MLRETLFSRRTNSINSSMMTLKASTISEGFWKQKHTATSLKGQVSKIHKNNLQHQHRFSLPPERICKHNAPGNRQPIQSQWRNRHDCAWWRHAKLEQVCGLPQVLASLTSWREQWRQDCDFSVLQAVTSRQHHVTCDLDRFVLRQPGGAFELCFDRVTISSEVDEDGVVLFPRKPKKNSK